MEVGLHASIRMYRRAACANNSSRLTQFDGLRRSDQSAPTAALCAVSRSSMRHGAWRSAGSLVRQRDIRQSTVVVQLGARLLLEMVGPPQPLDGGVMLEM